MRVKEQLLLFSTKKIATKKSYLENLTSIISSDLDFQDANNNHSVHNFHSFPAKFPPQLPRVFIHELTNKGDIVLDPMVGSGTTIVEASLAGRKGIGFDIDPLALKIAEVKTFPIDLKKALELAREIYKNASKDLTTSPSSTVEQVNLSIYNKN
jgi:DNA modification methylase